MIKFMDIAGQRFGKLTVIKRADNSTHGEVRWFCKCDCGNDKIVLGMRLRSKATKSCGCLKSESSGRRITEMKGLKFGKLTVIKRDRKSRSGAYMWLCQCECGNERVMHGRNLRAGRAKSCGCSKKEHRKRGPQSLRLPEGEATFNKILRTYKVNAERKKLDFTLTRDEFKNLTKQSCHYCGTPPNNTKRSTNDTGDYTYNGLDRQDGNLGYTIENCVPCCWDCNRIKGTLNTDDFMALIKRIYNHHKSKSLKVV